MNKVIDSPEIETAQPAEISGEMGVIYTPEPEEFEIIAGIAPGSKGSAGLSDQARELIFNEEELIVMVHETTDENAENPIFTSCQGVPQYFSRGVEQRVKRKYVAILASCKEHAVSTPTYTAPDGARAMSIKRTSSLKYPFSVLHDPNPRGPAWLKGLIAAPT